jgi:hypothetical protein
MLAQPERQAKTNGIYKLSPFQYQITVPNNERKVVLDNHGKHAAGR